LNLQFIEGSAQLTEIDKKYLRKRFNNFFKKMVCTIEIASHFDSKRPDKVNSRISVLRGKAIANFLIEDLKVNPKLIKVNGYGNLKPLKPCDRNSLIVKCTEKNYKANSRVEFRAINFNESNNDKEWFFNKEKGFWCYNKLLKAKTN